MARMIPIVVPEHTQSKAERMLFSILRDELDDSFTVFHSFDLLTRNKENKFIDGEIDFLIFTPRRGFLVLEVKGGTIRYDGTTGNWEQNNQRLARSPFEQARAAKYQLSRFLTGRLGAAPDVAFAHAVCFPDVFNDMNDLPSGAEPSICITGKDLSNIYGVVASAMAAFRKSSRTLGERENERIRHVLMPYCEYGISLTDRMRLADRTILALTENQCQVLDFISRHRRALIEGCAGSGKTVMAVKKARELADKGKSVLLLAFNRLIGEHLADSVADMENVKASTYHKFCMDALREAECLPPPRNVPAYWENEIPEAFAALLRDKPAKYDAVVVDEGQDFRTEYWVTIEEMVNTDGHFYIFYDPGQNLFGTDMQFPISGEPFTLEDNCRNTRAVFNALKPYAVTGMRQIAGAPEGENVVELSSPSVQGRRKHLGRILHNLVNERKLDRNRIVVLGGHSIGKTCIDDRRQLGNFRIITEEEEDEPGCIHYHTYMKFKGCEADAVILLDVDPDDDRWSDSALYTAISRTRHLLYVIRVE